MTPNLGRSAPPAPVPAVTDPPAQSAKATVDVVRRPGVLRVFEELPGWPGFDDVTRRIMRSQEKSTVIRHAVRLLHVVRDDDDRDLVGQLADRLLDLVRGRRIESGAWLVHQQD